MSDDRRLIEDYLPIEAISAEASREKSVRKGHISTLHLWWARRPLVACRAAVYGALVPASRFVPNGATDEKKKSLGRANAARFVRRLCRYPSDSKPDEKADIDRAVREAQRHILEAHAERLTKETWSKVKVTVEDIMAGRAARPKVLDMFAGGGAIPLEALRLGCEAYALELNPVAYIIELCTLVYPQKYGKPDPAARGMTGPKNGRGESTWGGLAAEVRYWGNYVLKQVKAEIGDLYPLIPDPDFKGKKAAVQSDWLKEHASNDVPAGYLMPVAYLWTRTVTCKNPSCCATIPLVRHTWLCKKANRYVAMKIVAPKGEKQVRFQVDEASSEKGFGFDPSVGSTAGNATCSFCTNVADSEYVQREGIAGRIGMQMMAVVCSRPGYKGKVYLSVDSATLETVRNANIRERIEMVGRRAGLSVPSEPISNLRPSPNARGLSGLTRYGVSDFGKLFTDRQQLLLLSICATISNLELSEERSRAIAAYLGLLVGRIANQNCAFTVYHTIGEKIEGPMGDKKVPMVWDFPETNPWSGLTGGVDNALGWITGVIKQLQDIDFSASACRGDATRLSYADDTFDAVVTDPPYYDNVPYADISDFFYVWLRPCLARHYPDHFAAVLTPKKTELTALSARHQGDMTAATHEYELRMALALAEAGRVLKRGGHIVIVYAHKTTLGWVTLIEALRQSCFIVVESWPIKTEMPAGKVKIDKAMLASSIFLVASKGFREASGSYEEQVHPELEAIVRERVATLWEQGVSGADLVIACVGAGLRAFTRFARVEYANGEEVPAERFLAEVETVVLETILTKLSKEVGAKSGKYSLAGLDPATRFYLLWRYTYKNTELDAGEAIIFANGTHVELDGLHGLSSGRRPLIAKKKNKYAMLHYMDRGDNDKLGLPTEDGQAAPLIDVLHRTLWLMEHRPREIGKFLIQAGPNREQMRLAVQALTGPALKGGELSDVSPTGELAALAKLAANWCSVVDDAVTSAREREDRRTGQRDIFG